MIDFLLLHRRRLALLVGVLTLVFLAGLTQIQLDFSFDGFFPKDDEEFIYYQGYQEQFTETQNFMNSLAIKAPGKDIFDAEFLTKVDSIFEEIGNIEGIDSMIVGTRFGEIRRRGLGYSLKPFLPFDDPEKLEKARIALQGDTSFVGSFASKDMEYVCGYFFLRSELFDTRERDIISYKIGDIAKSSGFEYILSGIPYIRSQYINKLGNELLVFLSLAALLLVVVLFLLYRTFWGVAIPLVVAFGSLVWTLGLMGAAGQSLSFLSNLLIPIMFVVSMSDVIHIMTKYLALVKSGIDKEKALRQTLSQIGFATFLTSLTTAIGFGALMVSRMEPIRMFGLYAAVGVFFTFLVAVTILVFSIMVLKPEQFSRRQAFSNSTVWTRLLDGLNEFTKRYARGIAIASVFILAGSIFLITRIPLDNYLIQDMASKDPVRISMDFFEEEFYGMRPFELAIHTKPPHKVTDREVLLEMQKIEAHLHETGKFGPFLSAPSILRNANYIYHYSKPQYQKIPDEQEDIDELLAITDLNGGSGVISLIMNEERTLGRISSRIPDIGTDAFAKLNEDLERFITTESDTTLFNHRMTGHAFLTEHNLLYLRDSLLWGLSIAFVLIGIIMGLQFRSWKMLVISMFPNVVPLLLTGAVMGMFGITLSTSTSIVFIIAFGIAVDDTIHFLTRFRLERKNGADVDTAIRNTMLGTGKALVLTSIVLLCGFSLLLASSFGGTFSTGFFTALTIVFALVADLLLLPVLLRWFYGD